MADIPISIHDHAQKLRDTWQGRVLAESDGKTRAVVVIVLFHAYSKVIKTLLRVVFPTMRDLVPPFISSAATIMLNGKLVADVTYSGGIVTPKVIYESTDELNKDMRDLADRLKLTDPERLEFTAAIQKWVVADQRVDQLGRRKLDS